MALRIKTSVRTTMANAIITEIDSGAGAGIVAIYEGTRPASLATAPTGGDDVLAKITLNDPCATESNGVITFDVTPAIEDASADVGGTATWFRVYKSADGTTIDEANAVIDGTCTASGGGGDMILNSTTITATGPVEITSWTITVGA
jgi:hypothetical protein